MNNTVVYDITSEKNADKTISPRKSMEAFTLPINCTEAMITSIDNKEIKKINRLCRKDKSFNR